MEGRIIETADDVAEGADWLARREPRFAVLLEETGPLPLRRRADGFDALLDAVLGQQVSTAAAAAMRARLAAAGLLEQAALARASEDSLRACGLSRQKIRYVQAIARAQIDYAGLRRASDEEVIATLVALPGIGRWTAEVYALISLGRADVFAPGDLALREAVRMLFDLPERPSEAAVRAMAEHWRPWRAVAARALWAYYRLGRKREGIR